MSFASINVFNAVCLLILLLSAAGAARMALRGWGRCPLATPIDRVIAWGTWSVAFALLGFMLPALASDLLDLHLVRMPIVAGVAVAMLPAIHWATRRRLPEPVDHDGPARQGSAWWLWQGELTSAGTGRWVMLAAVIPVAVLHIFLLADALLRPPMAFDGLCYHLPMIARWLTEHRLVMLPEVWQLSGPGNGELWQTGFASLGIENFIEPSMAPIGLLLTLVVFGIARQVGAGRAAATVCAALVLASPMVAMQMYSSYVDLFGTTFLLGGLYWVLRLIRIRDDAVSSRRCAWLAGLSLGIALGTKHSFIAWSLPLVAIFAAAWAWPGRQVARGKAQQQARRWTLAAVFVGGMLVCSGYWYVRATLHTGWPLYPLKLNVAGHDLGAGRAASEICSDLTRQGWASLVYPWVEAKRRGHPYAVDGGLGPMFVVFAVAGVAYLAWRSWLRRRRRAWGPSLAVMFWAVCGIVLFVEVCFSYARYALPLWAVLFAAAAPMMGLLIRRSPRTVAVLVGLTTTMSVCIMGFWPAKTLADRLYHGHLDRWATYPVPVLVDHLPPGTVVLNLASSAENYPLLGASLGNRVIERMIADSRGLTPPLTRAQLNANAVDVVYVRSRREPLFAPDVSCVEVHDDADDPAWTHDMPPARIYRILRDEASPIACRTADADETLSVTDAHGSAPPTPDLPAHR